MTRAVQDRILKDMNGNISDHLRNHIHLTNCVHLKNHVHKSSPILADRELMRDLVILRRSRSLRDLSASPPSWHSPSAIDVLLKRGEVDDLVGGKRSVCKECGRISPAPKAHLSSRGGKDGIRGERRVISCERILENDVRCVDEDEDKDGNWEKKGGYRQDRQLKILSDQLRGSDGAVSSCNHGNGRQIHSEKVHEEGGVSICHRSSLNRGKRHAGYVVQEEVGLLLLREMVRHRMKLSVASNPPSLQSGCQW